MEMLLWHKYEVAGKLKGGGGVRARYSGKHDIEIMVDPKSTPSGPTFWLGFEPPDSNGAD